MITEAEASSYISSIPAHTLASMEFIEHLLETELPIVELLDHFVADAPATMPLASISHVPAIDVPAIETSLLLPVTAGHLAAPVIAPVVQDIVWPQKLETSFLKDNARVAYILVFSARDLFLARVFITSGGPWHSSRTAYIAMATEVLGEVTQTYINFQHSLPLDARVFPEGRKYQFTLTPL
jgi:hypothetical protein